jgi:hypothetical protein
MISRGYLTPWYIALSNSPKFLLRGPEGRIWGLSAISLHKTSFFDLVQVDFSMLGMQEMRTNLLSTPWKLLHLFHHSRFLRRPEGRLWVLRTIRLLKTSLKRLRKSLFRWPRCRKCSYMTFRHLDISLYRLHKIRYLRRSEGRLWVLSAIRVLGTS